MADRFQELSKIWLEKAEDDILWAKDSLHDKHFSGVCFLSQQIAEKSLKSYLFSKKAKLVRTHNLLRLLALCKKFDSSFNKFEPSCLILNSYYIDTRYPDIWDITRFESQKQAVEALELSEQICEFVKNKL